MELWSIVCKWQLSLTVHCKAIYLFQCLLLSSTEICKQTFRDLRFSQRYWWGFEPSGKWRRIDVSFRHFEGSCCLQLEGSSSRRRADCLKHSSNSRLPEARLWQQTAWSTPQQQTAWSTPPTADCFKHTSKEAASRPRRFESSNLRDCSDFFWLKSWLIISLNICK